MLSTLAHFFSSPTPVSLTFGFHLLLFAGRAFVEGRAREASRHEKVKKSRVTWQDKLLMFGVRFAELQPLIFSGLKILEESRSSSSSSSSSPSIQSATSSPLQKRPPPPLWLFSIGSLISSAGLALFFSAHEALGKNYSMTLEIHEKHKLITKVLPTKNGGKPRAYVIRHPIYFSMLMMGTGFLFITASWPPRVNSLYLIMSAWMAFLRIPEEEAMMMQEFGEAYVEYKQRTWALIPYVW